MRQVVTPGIFVWFLLCRSHESEQLEVNPSMASIQGKGELGRIHIDYFDVKRGTSRMASENGMNSYDRTIVSYTLEKEPNNIRRTVSTLKNITLKNINGKVASPIQWTRRPGTRRTRADIGVGFPKETREGILFHGFKAVFFLRMEIWASEANSIRVFGSCVLLREETMDTECAWEVVLRRVHGVAD